MNQNIAEKKYGLAIPLGALYTKHNHVIGEFLDLIPLSDFCIKNGFSIIQLLPVNDSGTQSSPYSALSAFALHPLYIRISELVEFSLLYKKDKEFTALYDSFIKENPYKNRYDYQKILGQKTLLLKKLYMQSSIYKTSECDKELENFILQNSWVKSYCVYKALKEKYMQKSWKEWDKGDKILSLQEIHSRFNDKSLKQEHLFFAWCQLLAQNQFLKAVEYAHKNGIQLKGDMPILMNEDSCDAWAYPEFFNQNLKAGSPSDGDNPSGQNWGFPIYNWENLKKNDFSWWLERLKNASKFYDYYRLDHILGFFRIWAIPEDDVNALNGFTVPTAFIKKEELYELGFDDDRIRWLSCPHIPTSVIEDITWNHENAHKILSLFCTKLENEELWLFNDNFASKTIIQKDLSPFCTQQACAKIKDILIDYYSNKTFIQKQKNQFIPLWTYQNSTSWKSLSESEKQKLTQLFQKLNQKALKLWQNQANQIFTAINNCKEITMTACGEDLGISISCVPQVMKKHNILGLRVIRWCRNWEKENQPYQDFAEYEPLSVSTTSVHDSSTLRQWWNQEKQSVVEFIKLNYKAFNIEKLEKEFSTEELEKINLYASKDFCPEIAKIVLRQCAKTKSSLFIPPLQDLLYLSKEYYLQDESLERINVPGTVNNFNWTYRMPVCIEELCELKICIFD